MITRMLIVFFLVFTAAFATEKVDIDTKIVNAIQKRWNEQPTMEKLFDNLQKEMGPEMYSFLTEKMKSAGLLQAKPPKLEKNGDKGFLVSLGNSKIPVEFKSLTNSTIVVNHHELTFKPNEKSADIFKKIQAALPEKMGSLLNLFVHEAYAAPDFKIAALQVSAATAAGFQSARMDMQCYDLSSLHTDCNNAKIVVDSHALLRTKGEKTTSAADDIRDARDKIKAIQFNPVMTQPAPSLCENGVKDVQACLDLFVDFGKKYLKVDLREGSSAPSPPPAGSKSIND
jgi:hypothetical protein